MIQDWIATATPTANGQRLFEEVDYDDYRLKKVKFEDLPADKKQNYKGTVVYFKTGGQIARRNGFLCKMTCVN